MATQKPVSPLRNRCFRALLAAQFLGAYNDNLFKMLVSLMAIDAADTALGSGGYLSLTGAVFIIPYLLFSGYAGHAADRFGKRGVLVITKSLEVAIMGLALLALVAGNVYAMLAVLFLLAAQSTFFSPAKFGVLPEMLLAGQLAEANGHLEMARYVAVILGSVSAGGLLVLFSDQPMALGGVLLAVAIVGAVLTARIRPTAVAGSRARLRINPFASVVTGARRIMADRSLRNAVAGITYLESMAAFVMMDILLVGKDVLGLDDLGTGALLAISGIGIGIGATIAGRLSVGRINLGLTRPAAAGIAAALIGLSQSGHSVILTAIMIGLVGVFGGIYLVPLYANLQHRAGAAERGITIGANNFINMAGSLAACGLLWVAHEVFAIAADDILLLAGALATAAAIVQAGAWGKLRSAMAAGTRAGTDIERATLLVTVERRATH